jgi:hypothetical protein
MLATGANIVASAQAVAGGGVFKTRAYIFSCCCKIRISGYYQIQVLTQFMLQQMLFIAAGFPNVAAVSAAPVEYLTSSFIEPCSRDW